MEGAWKRLGIAIEGRVLVSDEGPGGFEGNGDRTAMDGIRSVYVDTVSCMIFDLLVEKRRHLDVLVGQVERLARRRRD